MQSFYDLRGAIGSIGAIDYERMQEGSGPKYSDRGGSTNPINFVVDVENVARKKLTGSQYMLFKRHYVDTIANLDTVPNHLHADMQETLAEAFRDCKIYPLTVYFGRG